VKFNKIEADEHVIYVFLFFSFERFLAFNCDKYFPLIPIEAVSTQ